MRLLSEHGKGTEVTEWSLANLCNFTPKGLLQSRACLDRGGRGVMFWGVQKKATTEMLWLSS